MWRSLRWVMLLLCVGLLAKNVVSEATTWSVAGFLAALAAWYWLTRRRARELDGRRG